MYKAEVLRLFVASPGDLKTERAAIRDHLARWNETHGESMLTHFVARMWEFDIPHGGFDELGAQKLIDTLLVESADACLALFWTTLGAVDKNGATNTAHELALVQNSGRPTFVWTKDAAIPVNITSRRADVESFRDARRREGYLTSSFKSKPDLFKLLDSLLLDLAKNRPRHATRSPDPTNVTRFQGQLHKSGMAGYFTLKNVGEDELVVNEINFVAGAGASPVLAGEAPPGRIVPGGVWRDMLYFASPVSEICVAVKFTHPDLGRLVEMIEVPS